MTFWFCTFFGEFTTLCIQCVGESEREYDEEEFIADCESHKWLNLCDGCGISG